MRVASVVALACVLAVLACGPAPERAAPTSAHAPGRHEDAASAPRPSYESALPNPVVAPVDAVLWSKDDADSDAGVSELIDPADSGCAPTRTIPPPPKAPQVLPPARPPLPPDPPLNLPKYLPAPR